MLLIIGLKHSEYKEIIPSPLIGQQAPAFELPTLTDHRIVNSSSLRGKPYLLNIWASWCPGCRVEHELITSIADQGIIPVYGLSYKDAEHDATRWLERFGNPYTEVLVDQAGKVGIDYGVYGAPETFVIDAKGVIRHKHVGPLDIKTWEKELLPLIMTLDEPQS